MASACGRLSIGAVSRATGIPVETLRTWEQRYGFPVPERTPAGHRVYATTIVPRLRRIADALARGHRASEVVGASDAELAALLFASAPPRAAMVAAPPANAIDLAPLLAAVTTYDAAALRQALLADWATLGPLGCLEQRVGPLLRAVGEHWANGSLEIRHEHFLSETLGDLLRMLRDPFDRCADGPTIVLTTLPGETHGLGLQMAATMMATAGLRVVHAGCQTPIDQIVGLTRDVGAHAVAVSVSSASRGGATRRMLGALLRALPAHVRVIVGGAGAPASLDRADVVGTLTGLLAWSQALRRMPDGPLTPFG